MPGSLAKRCAGTPWRSNRPPSSMEDEAARCGHHLESGWPYGGEFRLLHPLPSPARSHRAGEPTGTRTCQVAGTAPKADGRANGGGRDLLVPRMEDAPPARQRVLNTRGGRKIAGLDTSVFRWRRLSR